MYCCCRTLFLLLLWLAVSPGTLPAQTNLDRLAEVTPDYVVRHFSMQDGLPSDQVRAVLQSDAGYLWVATQDGLARFDGEGFRDFTVANTPQLQNNLINCLYEDRESRLWLGSDTGEIFWLDRAGFHMLDQNLNRHNAPINHIVEADGNRLWILDRDGFLTALNLTDPKLMTVTNLAARYSDLVQDAGGRVWLAQLGNGRLAWLNGCEAVNADEPASAWFGWRNIAPARSGGLWVRDGQHLRRLDHGQWVEDRGVHSWPANIWVRLLEGSNGQVWVVSPTSGLYEVDKAGKEQVVHLDSGLGNGAVSALCEDREHNLWVGTYGAGVDFLRPRVLTMVDPADHWQDKPLESVCLATNGDLWIGTLGAGVYHYDGKHFSRLPNEPADADLRVRTIFQEHAGTLWIGAAPLRCWQGGRLVPPAVPFEIPKLVYATFEDRAGGLWFGTQNGLLHEAAGTWEILGRDLKRHEVRCITEAADGAMWIGLRGGGVARYQGGKFTQYLKADGLPSDYVISLFAATNGDVWIGTGGAGLVRWHGGRFDTFTKADGLPSDYICHISDDDQGHLWVGSYGGIFRVDKEALDRPTHGQIPTVNCLVLNQSDGLTSLDLGADDQPNACRTPDGRLWFATSGGLAMVAPSRIRVNRVLPPVLIERVRVDARTIYDNPSGLPALGGRREYLVEIPPGAAQVEIAYTALSLEAPQRVRFKYQMRGLDSRWAEESARRSVDFFHLPPGDYEFRVTACNNDGYWNNDGAVLRLRVLPFFWQTWWFALLGWLGGLALVCTGIALTLRHRYRRRMEVLNQARLIETERARIAQDLHDDLGSGLTEITTSCALALDESLPPVEGRTYLTEISARAQEMVGALDEIVWAVNPKNDNVKSLASYLCHFAGQFLRNRSLRCRFELAADLPALPLNTHQRYGLLLAVKEALNNAIKHSGGSELRLAIRLDGPMLIVEIRDNGRGLAGGEDLPGADGLENMRNRLRQLGGTAQISSPPGEGTCVQFRLPLPAEPSGG